MVCKKKAYLEELHNIEAIPFGHQVFAPKILITALDQIYDHTIV